MIRDGLYRNSDRVFFRCTFLTRSLAREPERRSHLDRESAESNSPRIDVVEDLVQPVHKERLEIFSLGLQFPMLTRTDIGRIENNRDQGVGTIFENLFESIPPRPEPHVSRMVKKFEIHEIIGFNAV